MNTVTVSPKYQVVIPSKIREALRIKPGQKVQILQYLDRIEIIPVRPISEMKGFLIGIDTNFIRDEEDRI